MASFERVLMPGLDKDQYSVLWVEHQDKGRLELNFLIPNTELLTGKRLQPYYDRADRPRINAWQTIVNGRPSGSEAGSCPVDVTRGLLSLAPVRELKPARIVARRRVQVLVVRTTKKQYRVLPARTGRNIRDSRRAIGEQSFKR